MANLKQYFFTRIRISLVGRWCTIDIFLLCLLVSTDTRIRCYGALFMSLVVSNSGGFLPLLLADTNRHERDRLFSWTFPTVLCCICNVLLLIDAIQHNIPMALVIVIIKRKIRVKWSSHVHSPTKSTVHMLCIGTFGVNLLLPYKYIPDATLFACSL